ISISACQNGIILCFQDVSEQYLTIRSNIHSGTPSENKFLQVPENDFIFSSIAPSWEQIGKLGAIAVIRTGLNYFLMREVREESKNSAEEEKISKVQTEP
ncbi:MAG: DUF1622 domain-containing protein, partial [Bacteroidota bacterium]|nr:DUF1622 domain-containing protein [Bacteroidota bacterium]